MGRVEGKVAFVTGAARGQGRAHSVRMAEEGADIIAIDACATIDAYEGGSLAELEETAAAVEALGRRISWGKVDIRDYDGVAAAVQKGVDELGRLDIVVAQAAVSLGGPVESIDESAWQVMLDVNLTGQWKTCRAAIPHLRAAGGGVILLTGSYASEHGLLGGASYCASKHGVLGLARVLANELGKDGIRVNAIHPSNVASPMLLDQKVYDRFRPDLENPTRADFEEAAKRLHLLEIPYLQPEDIANAALFLASEEARYITGVGLPVDAGAAAKTF